ncbi:MAG: CRISPR-associated helicase Cas3' [bacterium]
MGKTSASSGIYSHPGILLEDHLKDTAFLIEHFLGEKPVLPEPEVKRVARISALTHDLGKATNFFQQYLTEAEENKNTAKKLPETRHSLFSAICAYYLTKNLNLSFQLYPLFAFIAVKNHHLSLNDVMYDITVDNEDIALLNRQLDSIPEDRFSILRENLSPLGVSLPDKKTIEEWINAFRNECRHLRDTIRQLRGDDVNNYLMLNFLFSLLIDADKSAVVIKDRRMFCRPHLPGRELVNSYRNRANFTLSPLNQLRDRAYLEALNHNIDLKEKVYSLTLPTGLGKTLTVFAFALKLRDEIADRHGKAPRIIYALPFLSIIEQNAEVFEAVLGGNPPSSLLLKHHHLTDMFYRNQQSEFEPDAAKILIEGWNSEIIVTTFVQLFHTLLSNRNQNLRKFHRLANAIVILDEVQTVPVKYWYLLRILLGALAERFNMYTIFVTATQPLIFEENTPLIKNSAEYFKGLNRVVVKPRIGSPMTIDDLYTRFALNDNRRYLFILNTISSAKEFYHLFTQNGIDATFLTTHLIPRQRLQRIKEIKEKKYQVAVTTQLVEAGVDIDFDVVVRDIAPLDSINQAAGRCNRNGLRSGEVYVVKLKNEEGRFYASYIYDQVLLDITEKILSGKEEIPETAFLELINRYYLETKEKKSQSSSREYLQAVATLCYDTDDEKVSVANFRLIEDNKDNYDKFDVFVEVDETAACVWQCYSRLAEIHDIRKRKREFAALKPRFYQFVVSVPKSIENQPPLVGGIGYVSRDKLADYYDMDTGFITKERKSVVIW